MEQKALIDVTKGTVSQAKIADLLIINKNPLQDIDNTEPVYLVVKNGKIFNRED